MSMSVPVHTNAAVQQQHHHHQQRHHYPPSQPLAITQRLDAANEQSWIKLGNLAELMTDWERAMGLYEYALRHNPYSINALSSIASLCRAREQFGKAIEYFKRILAIQEKNGEIWSPLGHCYLMMDNLQDAYHAYQQALYHLPNPKDPKLWYGIGILYDRYGSIEHAEEAFSAVMKMDPHFEKTNEIYFRLGIIYKQQQKYDMSLQCFRYILHNPPPPLTEIDIWFQTGHVYEQQKEFEKAKDAYERVLADNPDHAKVLQQLGWLYHQPNTSFSSQVQAINFLTRSLKADGGDAQSWYLLGRCYMAEQNYNRAYEAYQQAVYRDARNPTFWCSIGVLYYQINQYRDALDAYSRAIRLNPYISEVWYDLGTLYESCSNQTQDALDAYQRAAELDPTSTHIHQRLELLRNTQGASSGGLVTIPVPQDVNNPYQYVSGTPRRTPHATTSHPLLTGTQQPSISQTPSCGQRTPTSNNDPARELPALQQGDRQAAAANESRDQQHRPYHMSSLPPAKLGRNNHHVSSPKSPVIRSLQNSNNNVDDHHLPAIDNATRHPPPIKLDAPPTTNTNSSADNIDDDAAADTLISLARKRPENRMTTDIGGDYEPGKRLKLSPMDTSSRTTTAAAAAAYESSTSPSEPRSPPHQSQQTETTTSTTTTPTTIQKNDPTVKEEADQRQLPIKHATSTTTNAIVDQNPTCDTLSSR